MEEFKNKKVGNMVVKIPTVFNIFEQWTYVLNPESCIIGWYEENRSEPPEIWEEKSGDFVSAIRHLLWRRLRHAACNDVTTLNQLNTSVSKFMHQKRNMFWGHSFWIEVDGKVVAGCDHEKHTLQFQ